MKYKNDLCVLKDGEIMEIKETFDIKIPYWTSSLRNVISNMCAK